MSSLFRHHSLRLSQRLHLFTARTQSITRPTSLPSLQTTTAPRRAYAPKKAKHGKQTRNANGTESTVHHASSKRTAHAPIATASLTPGSQQTLTDPTAREEFAHTDAKMAGCVEWLRREVSQLEAHASGHVTPQLLAPARVSVSAAGQSTSSSSAFASASASEAKRASQLEELATVGVRDRTTLVVIVFDPQVCCCKCARYQFRPSAPSGLASAVRDLYLNVELTRVCCWMCWMCMWRGRTI